MFDRLKLLIDIDKLKDKTVLVIGLGGVGGHAFESLIRSSIGNIIIIDSDKIDILNLLVTESFETLYKRKTIIDEPITEKVLNAMLEGKQVERADQKTVMDDWVSNIGYVYDINFKLSFQILKEKDYINKIINRTKTPEMEKIRIFVHKYIDEKI